MNSAHDELCSSPAWAAYLRSDVLPLVLHGHDFGGDMVEIGPGFGLATDVLRDKVTNLTAVEIDPKLAEGLARRLAGTNVTVLQADGTRLPFDAGCFSSAASFTMLHHVPSASQQDALLAEVARVLQPGGVLIGADSLDDAEFREFHTDDVCVPVDPTDLPSRLRRAGFSEASVGTSGGSALVRCSHLMGRPFARPGLHARRGAFLATLPGLAPGFILLRSPTYTWFLRRGRS